MCIYMVKVVNLKDMKKTIIAALVLAAGLLGLSSCLKDNGVDYSLFYPNALVTCKTSEAGEFYLQLDDKTTLKPLNVQASPFKGKQVRALTNFTDKGPYTPSGSGMKFDRAVEVNWIDSVRTKTTVMSTGDRVGDDKAYGIAPIEIIDNWVTVLEDGYLTLAFCADWGNPHRPHAVNLVQGADKDDPYYLEFRHDTLDDRFEMGGRTMNGIVAFDLSSLPDTGGKTVKMTIRYLSFRGERKVTFDYRSGAVSESGKSAPLASISRGLALN